MALKHSIILLPFVLYILCFLRTERSKKDIRQDTDATKKRREQRCKTYGKLKKKKKRTLIDTHTITRSVYVPISFLKTSSLLLSWNYINKNWDIKDSRAASSDWKPSSIRLKPNESSRWPCGREGRRLCQAIVRRSCAKPSEFLAVL